MNTVSRRARYTARTTTRDLRALIRDQRLSISDLARVIGSSELRAFAPRYVSTSWTVDEVCALISACAPASESVPVRGALARAAA